uniref:Aminopeptidase n=1 Tax=Crocodylus porosus TaxID=8502 RepID=A0A7M4FTJ3_CROPO
MAAAFFTLQPADQSAVLMKTLLLLSVLSVAGSVSSDHHSGTSEADHVASGNGSKLFPWDKMRLPKHVTPVHYDLIIHPNLTTLTFTGFAKIEVTVNQQTTSVILHSKHLQITRATIQGGKGNSYAETEVMVWEHPPFEQIALLAPEPLQVGQNYTVHIEYSANLSESFHGFYKSSYRTQEGEVRVLAITQFEPTAARMAFPCFDEPSFKAQFSVKIRREPKHLALSNMPIVRSVNISKWLVEDHFDVSVKMSTYLVAFMVSDFKSVSKMTRHGIKISIYAVPDKINQADYALDAAVKLLDFYEDYFSIPYPLPKQDLAAIPDFQSGAMENWGLTTYRESALLYDSEKSSASSKLWITMIIAHELAHQWFGNLVTMEWWDDLWLNEGFAKFMEYVSVSVTHPELKVVNYFLGKCFDAMEVDALNSSHPVSTPVEDPAQILEMFDDVSYEKGACILNMLWNYLTADVFKAGIVQYLRNYSYQNTKNEDLWNSLTNLQGDDESLEVGTMMNTWTLQKGFPLITVMAKGKNVYLQQEHYMKGSHFSPPTGYLWHVPLTYITSKSDTVQRFLLTTKTDVLILPEEVEWIKFNVGMNGYYIMHYEDDGWDNLISLLKENHTAISSNDRASLINNVFQLVSIGKLSISKALDLTLYLNRESQIMPVFQGMNELIPIYKLMEKRDMDNVENQLKEYIVNIFKNLIDKQSWNDEGSVSERLLRNSLLLFACARKYQPCVDKAEEYFMKWKESDGTLRLPSDVKAAVYAVGAQTVQGWDFLFSKYRLPSFNTEKNEIEVALSISRNKEKLQWLMDQGLLGDIVKTQDLPHIVVFVAKNPSGYHLAWKFLKENWNKLVKEFFSSLDEKSSHLRCIQQAIEIIEENIRWMDINFDKIKLWLQNNKI